MHQLTYLTTRNKLWHLHINSQATRSNHQQALAIISKRQRITISIRLL
jgi:hypothetical protein